MAVTLIGQTWWIGSTIGEMRATISMTDHRVAQIEQYGSPQLQALRSDILGLQIRVATLETAVGGRVIDIVRNTAQLQDLSVEVMRLRDWEQAAINRRADTEGRLARVDTVLQQLGGEVRTAGERLTEGVRRNGDEQKGQDLRIGRLEGLLEDWRARSLQVDKK